MNIYVIVEGEKAAKKIYQKWIPLVNKNLRNIDYLNEFEQNNFFIFFGGGQPSYWEKVGRAIDDVNNIQNIDRLVVSFDSEENTYENKLEEAENHIKKYGCNKDVKYVVQHFCIEAWLLGNRDIFRNKPQNQLLREYYFKYDIRNNDPEGLPSPKNGNMNRAQFAYNYLRLGISDTHGVSKWYNKKNPGIVLEEQYFNKIKQRHLNLNHIKSFKGFLDAFV